MGWEDVRMQADVCLVLEGSYPYITGGVSSWVHQLITGLPEVRFALLTLVPDAQFARQDRYAVPANVVARQDVMLFEGAPGARKEPGASLRRAIDALHDTPVAGRCPVMRSIAALTGARQQAATALLEAKAAWDMLQRLYAMRGREVSFLDYVWTWRATHAPLFRLLDAEIPQAPVYHAVSTGYAGFIAAIARLRGAPGMAITEHGLYTRERAIDIFQSSVLFKKPADRAAFVEQERFFKAWWRQTFDFAGRLAYDAADVIVTLHEPNRRMQLDAGAPGHKLEVVPNGLYPEKYAAARGERSWRDRPFRVGLIGRVVPIKDIKTFLRAIQLAAHEVPIEAYVLGPTDEDPDYHAACLELAAQLGLGETVTFTGKVDVAAWLARLDLNVLTSVSESQPLVILEAAAAGVPTVATDVGACRELLEGRPGEDEALGPSGLVVPVVSPDATARAIVALARDPERHARMAEAGLARVTRFYRQDDVLDYYRRLYRRLAAPAAVGVR
jgi:glycosyltransferase involved in cell wall biosynthesis